MKPISKRLKEQFSRRKAFLVPALLAFGAGSALADDPISNASATLTGLSAPVNAALILALAVFGAFCIYKVAKAILRAM